MIGNPLPPHLLANEFINKAALPGAQSRNCLLAVCSNEGIRHSQFHCRHLSIAAEKKTPQKTAQAVNKSARQLHV